MTALQVANSTIRKQYYWAGLRPQSQPRRFFLASASMVLGSRPTTLVRMVEKVLECW